MTRRYTGQRINRCTKQMPVGTPLNDKASQLIELERFVMTRSGMTGDRVALLARAERHPYDDLSGFFDEARALGKLHQEEAKRAFSVSLERAVSLGADRYRFPVGCATHDTRADEVVAVRTGSGALSFLASGDIKAGQLVRATSDGRVQAVARPYGPPASMPQAGSLAAFEHELNACVARYRPLINGWEMTQGPGSITVTLVSGGLKDPALAYIRGKLLEHTPMHCTLTIEQRTHR